MTNTVP